MSGFEGVIVAGLVLVAGTVFACVGLSYSNVKEVPAAASGYIDEPEVADRESSGNHRQAA